MTDWKALCRELVTAVESNCKEHVINHDLNCAYMKADAALTQPEPEGPSILADDAYIAFVQICKGSSDDAGAYEEDEALVRRALKRLAEYEKQQQSQWNPLITS